jgi:hypothetical protein
MNTQRIIAELDMEIASLQAARAALVGMLGADKPGSGRTKRITNFFATPAPKKTGRRVSEESRRRMAEAQKKRWAKLKKTKT